MTLSEAERTNLQSLAAAGRREIMAIAVAAKSHHVGSAFSMVELLTALYFRVLRVDPKNPQAAGRDRFILSKGHACLGWYVTLSQRGFFSSRELREHYGRDGGRLGFHPDRDAMPGIEVSSGSLGHGLSIGAGLALAAKLDQFPSRTYVLVGDGECNEGSVWEAALFAAHHRLDNLVAIVDYNRWQSFGRTDEVMNLEPLPGKWHAFGWAVREIDGHDFAAILDACAWAKVQPQPTAIIARTVKGKEWKNVEDTLESHYRLPTEDDLRRLGDST